MLIACYTFKFNSSVFRFNKYWHLVLERALSFHFSSLSPQFNLAFPSLSSALSLTPRWYNKIILSLFFALLYYLTYNIFLFLSKYVFVLYCRYYSISSSWLLIFFPSYLDFPCSFLRFFFSLSLSLSFFCNLFFHIFFNCSSVLYSSYSYSILLYTITLKFIESVIPYLFFSSL